MQSLLRKRRKLQLDLRYEDADEEQLELSNVAVSSAAPGQKELFRTEPGWTMQVKYF